MSSDASEVVEFSGFRLERGKRRLTGPDGAVIALKPKAFNTLAFLVAHAGEVLDKSAIFDAVWPGVVVEENNLNQVISALRRVLRDRRDAPRFIVTVPGRGYQFVAPVRSAEQHEPGTASPRPEAPQSGALQPEGRRSARLERHAGEMLGRAGRRANRLRLFGGIGTAALAAAALAAVLAPRPHAPAATTAAAMSAAPAPALSAAESTARESTLAVLPFVDLSEGKDQAYFADGLSVELMDRLSRINGLAVTAQTSAFFYKNRADDVRAIGVALGVDHVLEGSVRKSGDRVRISVQLVDAKNGYHQWSDTYDRDLGDVFAVEEDIGRAVADALSVEIGVGAYVLFGRQTTDAETYDLYLRASDFQRAAGASNELRAEMLYREALARDPDFFPVQRGLFLALYSIAFYRPERAAELHAEMNDIAERAIARARDAADGYYLRASQLLLVQGDLLGARRAVENGMAVASPAQRAELADLLAYVRTYAGSLPTALELWRARVRADPLAIMTSAGLQHFLYAAGRVDEAEAEYRRSLGLSGDRAIVEGDAMLRALVEGFAGPVVAERAARVRAAWGPQLASAIGILDAIDDRDAALARLRRELARAPDPGAVIPSVIAAAADYYGDVDLALEALAAQYRLLGKAPTVPWDGALKHVRSTPGFKDLMRRYGYEAYWRATGDWGDFCRPVGESDFGCR